MASLMPALGRQEQADPRVPSQAGLYSETLSLKQKKEK